MFAEAAIAAVTETQMIVELVQRRLDAILLRVLPRAVWPLAQADIMPHRNTIDLLDPRFVCDKVMSYFLHQDENNPLICAVDGRKRDLIHLAVGQNQWYHFEAEVHHPFLVYVFLGIGMFTGGYDLAFPWPFGSGFWGARKASAWR